MQLSHTFLQSRGIGERIFANKVLCYFSKELNRKYLEKKISLVIYFDVEKFGMFLMPFEKPQEGQSVRARQKLAHLLKTKTTNKISIFEKHVSRVSISKHIARHWMISVDKH